MPPKKESDDPIERKLRELIEKQKNLSDQISDITENIQPRKPGGSAQNDLVWRDDPDERLVNQLDTPARRRDLARKRAQDRIVFFLLVLISISLIYGLTILIPIYYVPHERVLSDLSHLGT